jgi:predicted DNA-binding ribbon-helix-helix protein
LRRFKSTNQTDSRQICQVLSCAPIAKKDATLRQFVQTVHEIKGRVRMCQVFAGQDPERYASATRRIRINGQSTSIRLENAFWQVIDTIADNDGMTTPIFISKLHSEVRELRGEPVNFTSLLRCACLKFMEISTLDDQTAVAAE